MKHILLKMNKNIILECVKESRASVSTKYHCLYGHYFLGLSRIQLATIYGKSRTTISSWIMQYEQDGLLTKAKKASVFRKFGKDKREWLIRLYERRPVLYLNEARKLFANHFGVSISASSICNILHANGLSWKVLERRAIQIRGTEILRFQQELSSFSWDFHQLLFLDEVAFANLEILRNKSYGVIGRSLLYRGEFRRRPRVSSLCFIGQSGIVDAFETEGTFTRQKFFDCCRTLALSGTIHSYPGRYSVWVMDGARIHCDDNIIKYLRSLGIIPILLPAYCPFYNPIEIIFGLIKRDLKRTYTEGDNTSLSMVVGSTLTRFTKYDCTKIFTKCGYCQGGTFNTASNDLSNLIVTE